MPSVYHSNKVDTCGISQEPIYGIKYSGNMWCNPHDVNRSCCSNNRCIPSKYCNPPQQPEDHLFYQKQDLKSVDFYKQQPIDFSDFVWPELSSFEIRNETCKFDLKNSLETCQILQTNKAGIRNIYFVGDSLTLNFYIGFMSHILKDYQYGPTKKELYQNNNIQNQDQDRQQNPDRKCNGYQEMLYRRKHCQSEPSSDLISNYDCDGTSVNFIDIRKKQDFYLVEDKIKELKNINQLESSLFVINSGTHEKFRFEMVKTHVLDKIKKLLPPKNLLWLNQVRPSFNIPKKYNRKKALWDRMNNFYKKVDGYVNQHQINKLDLKNIATHAFSPDGTHYTLGVQLMKVQLLLKYLDELK